MCVSECMLQFIFIFLLCLGMVMYREILKISPSLYFSKALFEGLIFGGAYIRKGLPMERNLYFKIDWPNLREVNLPFLLLFYFVFEGNFPSTSPRRLIFGGAYTWRGLFSEFYGMLINELILYKGKTKINWNKRKITASYIYRKAINEKRNFCNWNTGIWKDWLWRSFHNIVLNYYLPS